MEPAEWANKELMGLWETFSDGGKLTRRWPLLYNPLTRGGLLFVGLNPSWNEKWLREAWGRVQSEKSEFPRSGILNPAKLFEWDGSDPSQRKKQDIQDVDSVAVAKGVGDELYQYFRPMDKIATHVNMKDRWSHIDLFAVRERSQEELTKLLEIGSNGVGGSAFARRQLEISLELLERLQPMVVVVANALASAKLRHHWAEKEAIDDWSGDETFKKKGNHEIELNGRRTPVFFSSMLGGQRALDKYSRERLVWQVSRAVGQK